ncbi:MAG: LysR family transcriptional regulator [Burkholderiales bacterium]|nr:LysR family transcriptional regulator [Burkholderiales bacterium]
MDTLRAMRVFARVVDEGSLAGAARSLDLAPAVVTRLVAELEAHLGARLLNRTTRKLALTDVGEAYLDSTQRILAEVEEAEALAGAAVSEARGHLRVLAPPAVAVHQLAKHLPEFHRRHPQVTIELSAPGPVEAVDENFDLTLMARRDAPDGGYVARLLALTEVITCASPEYLERLGRPTHPSELDRHDVLIPPISEIQRGVRFVHGASGETFIAVPQRRSVLGTSHTDTNYAAALAGLGIAALPSFVIDDALREGALERVLLGWRLFSSQLWIGMPSRRYVPARTRALWDYLLEVFGGEARDPWLAAAGCETLAAPCSGCSG